MENKLKNKNTKNVGKFNTVDMLLIALVLVVLVIAFLVFDPFSWVSKNNTEPATIMYTVEIRGVSNELKENIKHGDPAVNASTDYDMGKVISVESSKSYVWEYSEGDEYMHKEEVVGKSDLIIVLQVDVVYEESVGYLLDGKHIAVGSQLGLCFPNYIGTGYCIAVERTDK